TFLLIAIRREDFSRAYKYNHGSDCLLLTQTLQKYEIYQFHYLPNYNLWRVFNQNFADHEICRSRWVSSHRGEINIVSDENYRFYPPSSRLASQCDRLFSEDFTF